MALLDGRNMLHGTSMGASVKHKLTHLSAGRGGLRHWGIHNLFHKTSLVVLMKLVVVVLDCALRKCMSAQFKFEAIFESETYCHGAKSMRARLPATSAPPGRTTKKIELAATARPHSHPRHVQQRPGLHCRRHHQSIVISTKVSMICSTKRC